MKIEVEQGEKKICYTLHKVPEIQISINRSVYSISIHTDKINRKFVIFYGKFLNWPESQEKSFL